MDMIITPGRLRGTVLIPPSKSDSQRAILAAACVDGTSALYNVGRSNDEQSMLQNIALLGAKVEQDKDAVRITGIDQFPQEIELNIGESGLGLRLMAAMCAVHAGSQTLTGDGSILKRPQGFFEEHLTHFGVQVESNEGFLPLKISGKMIGGMMEVDGSMSSQFLSGLLMALPLLDTDSTLVVRNLKSIPYVQMTLDTLNSFGISIENRGFEDFRIAGKQHYQPIKYAIESDWSSASYWLVASALGHPIKLVGLSLDSRQADLALLDAFVAANCAVTADEIGISVEGSHRKAFAFDATHCPDLFPALVAFASFCDGISIFTGVRRLKNKESDRGTVLQEEFGKLGVRIELDDDNMRVHGGGAMHSALVSSHNDHRIAMCLGIVGLMLENGLTIQGAESVAKSYPGFWEDLNSLMPIAPKTS